jgi:hypothetical protein
LPTTPVAVVTKTNFRLVLSGTRGFTVPNGQTLEITDLVFGNPDGATTGTFQVKRGGDVLFELNLGNYRDLDYHFVTPIEVPGGADVTIDSSGDCGSCGNASLNVSGDLH